jgi:spore coat protein A
VARFEPGTGFPPTFVLPFVLLLLLSYQPGNAATTTITPVQDNTIAQGTDPGSGENFEDNSSGACENVFSGNTNDGFRRRTLLQFDIAGTIPAGSTINSATLTMTVDRSGDNQDASMTLYSVTKPWGEGVAGCGPRGGGQGEPAGTGDATWLDAEYTVTPWATPGGDPGPASATALVGSGNGNQGVWSGPVMASDVQGWLDNPASNFGWLLVGDESRNSTARRFSSREGAQPSTLQIDFTPRGDVFACCFSDGSCTVTDTTSCTGQDGTPNTDTTSCEPNICPQPVGACCNLDESCSNTVDRLSCELAGGVFQGGGSSCSQGAVDCGLTPFVDPLPIPPVLQPVGTRLDGVPQYNVEVLATRQSLHSELPDTDLWTYNGAYPSFTIEAMRNAPIEVTYINSLPATGNRGGHILDVDECAHGPNYYSDSARIVTHLHGGHLPARFDGHPELTILPGEIDVYDYPNNQDAATLWYHDHALGITRLNVYAGMAGFYLLRDAEDTGDAGNTFGLPSGEYEIPVVIQDREFNPDGSLFYNPTIQNAFKGDRIVVNGKVWPYLNVKKGKYRLRLLNGSQSREYSLRLKNLADPSQVIPFYLIGTDLGLIGTPIALDDISVMSPAERFDVIIDFEPFAPGTEIVLRNGELTPPRIPNVLKFVVTDEEGFTGPLPATLRPVPPLNSENVPMRHFRLRRVDAACSNDSSRVIGEWLIESLDGPGGAVTGKQWDDITEFPILGTREIWEFENPTNSVHPMHVHLVKFQVLDKSDLASGIPIPLEPWEINTWKDTVRVPPNSRVRIIMDFEDYLGKFPYHCHILDHEDHEMMRQFQAMNDPAVCDNDGSCEAGEDCASCPGDCGQTSGALCGNGLCEAGDGENCVTCAQDCAGKQTGASDKQFCCGFDDNQVTNPIACGTDPGDNRCIDTGDELFCRVSERVAACCGDALCEGGETAASCALDCDTTCPREPEGPPPGAACTDGIDNDCDGLVDADDPDCTDTDADGLSDVFETNILLTDPRNKDTDGDGLADGYDGVVPAGTIAGGVDANGDGFVDGEQTLGTDASKEDTDGDRLSDGLEVANGSDPQDENSWPALADGDCAPRDGPDGEINTGDVLVGVRMALGIETATALELAHCDLYPENNPDGIFNIPDLLLLMQRALTPE